MAGIALAVAVAACGGGSAGADTFVGGTYRQAIAFTDCMRSHGVSQFPDPDSQGNYSNSQIQALDNNDPQQRSAWQQCSSLLPNGGSGLSVTQIQSIQEQNVRNAVKAAGCMRAHGITNFPDPGTSSQASGINWSPVFSAGFPNDTPGYAAAYKACGGGVGGALGPFLEPGAQAPPVSGATPSPGPGRTAQAGGS
jgi:hypothetical protein